MTLETRQACIASVKCYAWRTVKGWFVVSHATTPPLPRPQHVSLLPVARRRDGVTETFALELRVIISVEPSETVDTARSLPDALNDKSTAPSYSTVMERTLSWTSQRGKSERTLPGWPVWLKRGTQPPPSRHLQSSTSLRRVAFPKQLRPGPRRSRPPLAWPLSLGRDVRPSPALTRFRPPFHRRRQCSRRGCFLHRHRPAIPPGFRLHQNTTNKMARPNPRTAGNLNHLHLLCTPWNCFRRLLRLAREASSACSHAQAHLRLQPRPATDHQCPGLVGTILYFINKLHVVLWSSCRRTNERRNWHEPNHLMKKYYSPTVVESTIFRIFWLW